MTSSFSVARLVHLRSELLREAGRRRLVVLAANNKLDAHLRPAAWHAPVAAPTAGLRVEPPQQRPLLEVRRVGDDAEQHVGRVGRCGGLRRDVAVAAAGAEPLEAALDARDALFDAVLTAFTAAAAASANCAARLTSADPAAAVRGGEVTAQVAEAETQDRLEHAPLRVEETHPPNRGGRKRPHRGPKEFLRYKPLSQHTGTTRAQTGADWHTHRLTTGAA